MIWQLFCVYERKVIMKRQVYTVGLATFLCVGLVGCGATETKTTVTNEASIEELI